MDFCWIGQNIVRIRVTFLYFSPYLLHFLKLKILKPLKIKPLQFLRCFGKTLSNTLRNDRLINGDITFRLFPLGK